MILVRVQAHTNGRRCFVLGHRAHHWHVGLALAAAGIRFIWKDRADVPKTSA